MSLFGELKRRNVFKVGISYIVTAWILLQVVDIVLENITAPDWVMQVFMLAMVVGFPIVLIAAWALEMTPDGVKLQKNIDKDQSITHITSRRLNRNIMIALVVAVVLLLADKVWLRSPAEATPAVGITQQTGAEQLEKSIAVLPFRDMSAARDQAYFGEGIAEELLNALVKIEGLKVASRTSAFSLADEDLDIPAIAERLGVAHILEGSIRTSGQQVRVTAQLIEVSNDVHLWSETYDGSLDDIFKIQDEITDQITDALKVQLGGESLAPFSELLTGNAEAYQLYLQGRHLWRQRNSAALQQAVKLFNEAVELDPGFHQAWSNLAVAYLNLPDYDRSFDVNESFELGLEAAEKALKIWPQSTEALIIAANYREFHCDFLRAANLYEQAIAYNPNDPTAHHWYAILLGAVGRTTQALEHIQEAHRLDPLISAVIAIEAELNQSLGNYARAEELQRFAASLGIYNGSLMPVAINHLFAGDIQRGQALIEAEMDKVRPTEAKRLTLLVKALKDSSQEQVFETYIGTASESNRYETWDVMSLLAVLGSPYVYEFQKDLECPVVNSSVWTEPFRVQRGTTEFFNLMERAGVADYWREYGWPDDCASLDQTLAECP